MIIPDGTLLGYAVDGAFAFVLIGMALAFARLVAGPTMADRIVALDLVTVQSVAFMGLLCLGTGEAAFLDVAIAIALVGFLGTVAFARYVERAVARTTECEDRED
jgi:multicomponent Na+:H+ antiporter subunit F